MNYHYYTYDEFLGDIKYLYESINNAKIDIDVIVGVARGGLIPAVYLSHLLNKPMVPCGWSLRDDKTYKNVSYDEILSFGPNVLIVDDIIDCGDTMVQIVDNLMTHSHQFKITDCVLWQNSDSPYIANFCARSVDKSVYDEWVIFPWEKHVLEGIK